MCEVPGSYVAYHPHLGGAGDFVKIGHTGSLGDRLHDSAYVTCFSPNPAWRFICTAETETKEAAALVEAQALRMCHAQRVPGREVAQLTFEEAADLLRGAAEAAGVPFEFKHAPSYPQIRKRTEREVLDMPENAPTAPETPENAPTAPETPENASTAPETPENAPVMPEAPPLILEERAYQREACEACVLELAEHGRTVLQMACRCGKTRVAHKVIAQYVRTGRARILVLVPNLQLVNQTADVLQQYSVADGIECTVRRVGSAGGMTTDAAEIAGWLEAGPALVVSTYQSSHNTPDAFDLTVYDECHRTCGSKRASWSNHVLLNHVAGHHLFMTATPNYDTRLAINMRDTARFGGVAYRYPLRAGIDAGHVNDFSVHIVEEMKHTFMQILFALRDEWRASEGETKQARMLVFCNTIKGAEYVAEQVRAHAHRCTGLPTPVVCTVHSGLSPKDSAHMLASFASADAPALLFNVRQFQEGVTLPGLTSVFFASPRHSPRDIIQSVCRPLTRVAGKSRSRVYIPEPAPDFRDAAMGAGDAPRSAGADELDQDIMDAADGDVANLARFGSIAPYAEALASEDPKLYEHLLDPGANPYPLTWLGPSTGAAAATLLDVARRAVQYRYAKNTGARSVQWSTKPENLPWAEMYAELRRVVSECRRYPKGDDGCLIGTAVVDLHNWWKWAGKEYHRGRLEPYQRRDLEKLRDWKVRGIAGDITGMATGANPAPLALAFLEAELERTGGVMPMVRTDKGWGGLDATPVELLSAFARVVNNHDSKKHRRITTNKLWQDEMDRICGKWNLRWRKDRDADGNLVLGGGSKGTEYGGRPTCFQAAQARMTAEYGGDGSNPLVQQHFPGFPLKHTAQEELDVIRAGTAPLKYVAARVETKNGITTHYPAHLEQRPNFIKVRASLVATDAAVSE